MKQNQELMSQLLSLTQVNYSNGFAPLQDTLRAQTEFSKMATELLNMAAMGAVARARVNAIMGRAADTPLNILEEFKTPPPPGFDLAELQEEAQKHKPSIVNMKWARKWLRTALQRPENNNCRISKSVSAIRRPKWTEPRAGRPSSTAKMFPACRRTP
jgi:outer membrane protein TolC